jgi:hypothetical protein
LHDVSLWGSDGVEIAGVGAENSLDAMIRCKTVPFFYLRRVEKATLLWEARRRSGINAAQTWEKVAEGHLEPYALS